jgi:hypothetical protein
VFALNFCAGPFAHLAGEHCCQLVHGLEVWCGWSFVVESEEWMVLDVEVGSGASAGGGDVERFAGHGVVDEYVCGVDGATL